MKYTLTLITLLVCIFAYSQSTNDTTKYIINKGYGYQYFKWKVDSVMTVPHGTRDTLIKDPGQVKIIDTNFWYTGNDNHWHTPGSGSGTIDLSGFVQIQTQNPTATISGGFLQELINPTGDPLVYTVNWTAGRLAAGVNAKATDPIATILVGGIPQTFAQPPPGSTVSGTQSISVPRNINSTFSIVVTTTDGKTATASTVYPFSPKRYFGWTTTTSPTDEEILILGQEYSTSKAKDWVQGPPAPDGQHLVFAYPDSEGDLTDLKINGFPSIEAFTKVTRELTNASGYTQSYNIYISINLFTVTGTTTVSTQ